MDRMSNYHALSYISRGPACSLILSIPKYNVHLAFLKNIRYDIPYSSGRSIYVYEPFRGAVYHKSIMRTPDFEICLKDPYGKRVESADPMTVNATNITVLEWFRFSILHLDGMYIPTLVYTGAPLGQHYNDILFYMSRSIQNLWFVYDTAPRLKSCNMPVVAFLGKIPRPSVLEERNTGRIVAEQPPVLTGNDFDTPRAANQFLYFLGLQ